MKTRSSGGFLLTWILWSKLIFKTDVFLMISYEFFVSIRAWPLGIHTVTFCISENRGRIKALFDA